MMSSYHSSKRESGRAWAFISMESSWLDSAVHCECGSLVAVLYGGGKNSFSGLSHKFHILSQSWRALVGIFGRLFRPALPGELPTSAALMT